MDEPTRDELLADAIVCVALDVLDRLAARPEERSRFLHDLLDLLDRNGAREAAQGICWREH